MSNAPFTAPPAAWVTCPKCTAQVPCYDAAGSKYFCCFNCRTYFHAAPGAPAGTARTVSGFKQALLPGPYLPLGAAGLLAGYACRLTGYQVRGEKNDRTAEWREYQLRPAEPRASDDPIDFPLQLAEYEGHWLLIRRASSFPDVTGPRAVANHQWTSPTTGNTYRLWHRYQPLIRDAQGEFDWNILDDEHLKIQEFICPPYLLASEQAPNTRPTWYLAEHLEPTQVAAAFGVSSSSLPMRRGIGAAQPSRVPNWPQLRRLAWGSVLLLGLLQVLLLLLRPPTMLLEQGFTTGATGGSSQLLASRSFSVEGPAAVEVALKVPELDNHWVEVTASLVNEQTGRGYEFTRSVEYYHGYEDGESWTEGGTSTEAMLSSVPAGRYHVNLYPTLDQGLSVVGLGLRVDQNPPLWGNFWVLLLGLVAVPVGVGWWRSSLERERWANSDFNPYSSD